MIPRGIGTLLDQVFSTKERVDRTSLLQAAQAATLPQSWMALFEKLPEGEYTHDEALAALDHLQRQEGAADEVP
jgi:hypothetical protein